MTRDGARVLRRAYGRSFIEGVRITWPVLSALLLFKAALGVVVGLIEGWGIGLGIYFAFITGLMIGYGDLVPSQASTRVLSVAIGFAGVMLTGLVAALAVKAFQATAEFRSRLG